MPPALGRIAFHFSNSNKKHFYRNLTPSNTGQIKLVNFEKRLAKIRKKILKTQCISVYADVLMMYINLPVHDHIQEFTKETGFCNCYWFCSDTTMVSKKIKEKTKKKQLMTNRTEKVANHNKNSGSFFKLEKQNNLLNYQFKFMDYEAVI